MSNLPLIAHDRSDAVVAWCDRLPISAGRFIDEVHQVAALLPPGRHVLNLCGDLYHFAVTLAASILDGRISLLPASYTPEMVRQMRRIAPDVFCITDQTAGDIELPVFPYPEWAPRALAKRGIPAIACEQVVAEVFTSGSTGFPEPHVKRWGSLARNARTQAEGLGITRDHSILSTVPAQHMFGLESTVLMPLQSGGALQATRPFYPADIGAALAALPRPRVLVTTPYHLRTLLAGQTALPTADLLVSATAPLPLDLAITAEARFASPLLEIYGCTEAGRIASRRTTAGPIWKTYPGVRLRCEGESVWAEGDDIEGSVSLSDLIELVGGDPTRFLLQGRHADLVNIAGKRASLGYLNHQLNAIPGVRDGVFLPPPEDHDHRGGVGRLIALVVAPELTPADLMRALRERIDPVFLPRPLLFADALPRNAVGKLTGQALKALAAHLETRAAQEIPV